jgi:hypothetical protein
MFDSTILNVDKLRRNNEEPADLLIEACSLLVRIADENGVKTEGLDAGWYCK